MTETVFVQLAVNLGSFAVLAWIIFYVFKVWLPQSQKQYLESLREEREYFQAALDRFDRWATSLNESLQKLAEAQIAHDERSEQYFQNNMAIIKLMHKFINSAEVKS